MKRIIFKSSYSLLAITIISVNVFFVSKHSQAQAKDGVGLVCKWFVEGCPGGPDRQVCLIDGDGSNCECGAVTRLCN